MRIRSSGTKKIQNCCYRLCLAALLFSTVTLIIAPTPTQADGSPTPTPSPGGGVVSRTTQEIMDQAGSRKPVERGDGHAPGRLDPSGRGIRPGVPPGTWLRVTTVVITLTVGTLAIRIFSR
jgi:hypothetical protein